MARLIWLAALLALAACAERSERHTAAFTLVQLDLAAAAGPLLR